MPKYIVTDSAGKDRLVEAAAPANAIAFCAKDSFTAERVSDKVAALTKMTLEKVTADKPEAAGEQEPAEHAPEPDPEPAPSTRRKTGNATGDAI